MSSHVNSKTCGKRLTSSDILSLKTTSALIIRLTPATLSICSRLLCLRSRGINFTSDHAELARHSRPGVESRWPRDTRTHEISISRIEISVPIEIERGRPASGAYLQILASRTDGDRLAVLWVDFAAGLAVSTCSCRTNVLAFWPGRAGARGRGRGGAHEPGN